MNKEKSVSHTGPSLSKYNSKTIINDREWFIYYK